MSWLADATTQHPLLHLNQLHLYVVQFCKIKWVLWAGQIFKRWIDLPTIRINASTNFLHKWWPASMNSILMNAHQNTSYNCIILRHTLSFRSLIRIITKMKMAFHSKATYFGCLGAGELIKSA